MLQQVTFAWSKHFAAICALAILEGAVIGSMGFRLEAPEVLTHVWMPNSHWSTDNSGTWAASKIYLRQKESQAGATADVVMFNLQDRQFKRLVMGELNPAHIALSPNAHWLVCASTVGELHIISDPLDSVELSSKRLESPLQRVFGIEFSPDGTLLAAIGEQDTVLWDWATGAILWKSPNSRSREGSLVFSPDSKSLATDGANGRPVFLNTDNGHIWAEYPEAPHAMIGAAWSNKLQAWVVISHGNKTLEAWSFSPQMHRLLWSTQTHTRNPAVVVDENFLAFTQACTDHNFGRILLLNLEDGQVISETASQKIPSGIALLDERQFYGWNLGGNVWAYEDGERCWSTTLLNEAVRNW